MFGIEPDLVCSTCADRLRERYDVHRVTRLRARPPVLAALVIAVAATVYVVESFVPTPPTWLVHLVPNTQIWDGEVWRLLTGAFFHVGFLHILFNAWWCWDLGRGIESGWGHTALALLVAGGAAAASALQWMMEGPGVGLSGVVYALAGFLYALRRVHPVAASLMSQRTANFLIMWFVLCIVLSQAAEWRIANWAHGAGAVWGYLAGLATRSRVRWLAVGIVALVTVALVAATPFVAFGEQREVREAYLEWKRSPR
jgi:membrane associated rhomboid family serine protease